MPEVAQVECKGAVVPEANDLLHLLDIGRLAVGREAHDLVLVAVMREADELGHRLVENAQRVRKIDATVDRQRPALAQPPGRRRKIAESVDRDRDGLVVGRNQEGGREMAEMVLDHVRRSPELLLRKMALEVARDVGPLAAISQPAHHVIETDARRQREGELAPAVGGIVAVDRNMVDIGQRDPCLAQAIADRFAGKAAPMLDAAKTLLFDRCDEFAILDQAGGRVGVIGVEPENVGHAAMSIIRRSLRPVVSYRPILARDHHFHGSTLRATPRPHQILHRSCGSGTP